MTHTSSMSAMPALALLAGIGAASGAHEAAATPISFSINSNGAASATITFDTFDTGLGTLTGVSFTLGSSKAATTATLSVTGGEGGFNAGQVSADYRARAPGTLGALANTIFSASGLVTADCTSDYGFNCTDSKSDSPSFGTSFTLPSGDLDLYASAGPGTFDLLVDFNNIVIQTTTCVINGNCMTTGDVVWSGSIDVNYTYQAIEAIPEPGSLTLLAFGAAALATRARKRS